MRVKFWGVRGSIPSPNNSPDTRWKLREILSAARGLPLADPKELDEFLARLPYHLVQPVGDNTSCVEISQGADRIILDGGSGLRLLGLELGRQTDFTEKDLYLAIETGLDLTHYEYRAVDEEDLNLTLLFSHTHWDHIQGFPFFVPAYRPGNHLALYGRDRDRLSWALNLQQTAPELFPIPLDQMGARVEFHTFPESGLKIGKLNISAFEMPHPGGSLAYRIRSGKRTVVYATDFEFPVPESAQARGFVDFIAKADVLIGDTQYTYLESVAREGWGHSTSFRAVDLAMQAGVRNFFLFHHDPEHSDAKLLDNLDKTRAYYLMMSERGRMRIELAVEGLTLDI